MRNAAKEIIVFGGGCFWCTEAIFKQVKGVLSVTPGYAGGSTKEPTYAEVCHGNTGHAEVVQIEFDPEIITLKSLLHIFLGTHDPTTLNKQGNDVGPQYRSIILYTTEEQKQAAQQTIDALMKDNYFTQPIVTEIKPLENFFAAEDYHHNYYAKNPEQGYCRVIIDPKLHKLRQDYAQYLQN